MTKNERVVCSIFTISLCITLIILLLLFPQVAHEGADLGVALFMEALFPYLLPYLILSNWLIRLTANPLQSNSFLLYLKTYCISAVGGFPTGAATIAHLVKNGELTGRQASYLLGICHSPSPLFLLGFVGLELAGSKTISWQYLILLHSFSLLILWLLSLFAKERPKENVVFVKDPSPFTNSVKDSMPTVLIVAATIIFFTTIYSVFLHSTDTIFQTIPMTVQLFIASVLEMTNGLFLIHQQVTGPTLAMLTVILLTTQSLSIHLQVIVIARSAQIAIRPYIWIRALYCIAIPALFYLLFL